MKKTILFLLWLCSSARLYAQCDFDGSDSASVLPPAAPVNNGPCGNRDDYAPFDPQQHPIKTLRILFHVMRDNNGLNGLSQADAQVFLHDVLDMATWGINARMAQLAPMNYPAGNNIAHIADSRIRLELDPDPNDPADPDADGIYFHNSSADYYYAPDEQPYLGLYPAGTELGHRTWDYLPYAHSGQERINVMLLGWHPTVLNLGGGGEGGWYSRGTENAVMVVGAYERLYNLNNNGTQGPVPAGGIFSGWYYAYAVKSVANIVMHEIGHLLGLRHTYDQYGDDLFSGGDCPETIKLHPSGATNNLMDYNADMNALTPCQLGIIHYYLENDYYIRQKVKAAYCVPQADGDIDITAWQDVLWADSKTLRGHVRVKSGGRLTIRCRLGMPAGARITVEKGAKLWLDHAYITTGCAGSGLWSGIYVEGDPNSGQVYDYGSKLFPDQGWLLAEGATIEYAYMGISAGYIQPNGGPNLAGGAVIDVQNSNFINNRFAIRMYDYPGFANRSRISNSAFSCTGPLPPAGNPDGAYSFITLFNVRDIFLNGNSFENSGPHAAGNWWRGAGIISSNSTFYVQPLQNTFTQYNNCVVPTGIASSFKGLSYGIYIYNVNNIPGRQAVLTENYFEDVTVGISMNHDRGTIAYKNSFAYTPAFDPYPFNFPPTALQGLYASAFSLHENLVDYARYPSYAGYRGISITESNLVAASAAQGPASIYKNTLFNGNPAAGNNMGLELRGDYNDDLDIGCNTFVGFDYGIYIHSSNPFCIRSQGNSSKASGNRFSLCNNSQRLASSVAISPSVQYHYYSGFSNEDPSLCQQNFQPASFVPVSTLNLCPGSSVLDMYCPSGSAGSGGNAMQIRNGKRAFTDALQLNLQGHYSQALALLDSITDTTEQAFARFSLELYQGGRTYFTMSQAEQEMLKMQYSQGPESQLGQQIKNVLLVYAATLTPDMAPVPGTAPAPPAAMQQRSATHPATYCRLWPNPSPGKLEVEYQLAAGQTEATLLIYNLQGLPVFTYALYGATGLVQLKLPLAAGIYTYRLESGTESPTMGKLIILP